MDQVVSKGYPAMKKNNQAERAQNRSLLDTEDLLPTRGNERKQKSSYKPPNRLSSESPLAGDAIARRDSSPSTKLRDVSRYSCTRNESREETTGILIVVAGKDRGDLGVSCAGESSVSVAVRERRSRKTKRARFVRARNRDNRLRKGKKEGKKRKKRKKDNRDLLRKGFPGRGTKRFRGFQGHEAERRPWSSGGARFAFNSRLAWRARNCYIRSSYVHRQSRSLLFLFLARTVGREHCSAAG